MCCGVCKCKSVNYVIFTNIQINIYIFSWTTWFLNSIVLVSSCCREGIFLWMTISLCCLPYVWIWDLGTFVWQVSAKMSSGCFQPELHVERNGQKTHEKLLGQTVSIQHTESLDQCFCHRWFPIFVIKLFS